MDWLTDCAGPLDLCVLCVKSTAVGTVRQSGALGCGLAATSSVGCGRVPAGCGSTLHCIVSAFFLLFLLDRTATFSPKAGGRKSLQVVVEPWKGASERWHSCSFLQLVLGLAPQTTEGLKSDCITEVPWKLPLKRDSPTYQRQA